MTSTVKKALTRCNCMVHMDLLCALCSIVLSLHQVLNKVEELYHWNTWNSAHCIQE